MSEFFQSSLAGLRDKPFELLREMERLSSLAFADTSSAAGGADEWVGITDMLDSAKVMGQALQTLLLPKP